MFFASNIALLQALENVSEATVLIIVKSNLFISSEKNCYVSEEINKLDLTIISTIASDTFSRACNRAIFEAKNIGSKPSWKDLFEN